MSESIQYRDEPMGEIELVADFLPTPAKLVLKSDPTEVTLHLSTESVDFFKQAAREHQTSYQTMITQVLDEYVAHQKEISQKY